jgi:hypothetical protein
MISRALVLPAIGVAVLPKCPLCVMLVLGALGVAHPLHEHAFALLQGAALVLVVALLVLRHRRAPAQIVLAVAGAGAVMLGAAGVAPSAVGYGGAILLAAAWLWKPGGTADPSCGCAP